MSRQQRLAPTRRHLIAGATATGGAAALAVPATSAGASAKKGAAYLVGRGIADGTGPCAENGMMGYSMPQQQATGIHQRLWARAFVLVDRDSGQRVAWCVADQAMVPCAAHAKIVQRLSAKFPGIYDASNICLTATHTHASAGGCSHDLMYNLAILGFQEKSFDALVDGYVDAITQAHHDLAPGSVTVGRTTLNNASANRSRTAFDLNPEADKKHFPDAIDPQMVVLRFRQGSKDVGAISWFPTHGTSLPNTNTLLSGDNKGYAAYAWEREDLGQDYASKKPGFVAAFAQSAAGDMSPNLDLKPGTGPTTDPVRNVQIIGRRQTDAMKGAWRKAETPLAGSITSIARYIDLSKITVAPEYTPDQKEHRTSSAVIGATLLAGSVEDGPGLGNPEGTTGPLAQLWKHLNKKVPTWLKNEQAPKASVIPVGLIGGVTSKVLIQIVKIGQLYLVCLPSETTIVAGLRVRQAIAQEVGADLDDVLVQSYSNGYASYVTTPEEYESQQYEGGSTLYGKYELCAYTQELSRLGSALRAGRTVPLGSLGAPSPLGLLNLQPGVVHDTAPASKDFGDVVTQPRKTYAVGDEAAAVFVTGHPKNDLRRGGTFIEVQRKVGGAWKRVHDDSDFCTTFEWTRTNAITGTSTATVTWSIPDGQEAGTYRLVHHGAAKAPLTGAISSFTGASGPFSVS